MQPMTGIVLGILISLVAWRLGALDGSGALAAALTGSAIFGLGGLPWAAGLLTFFISSSVLSRAFGRRKAGIAEKFAKGSRRDWGQVVANGGLGVALVLWHAWQPDNPWLWLAFAGAMAAVNADTWATEAGVLSPVPPRRITTGQVVPPGSSGGVTLAGYLAALVGAGLVGGVAALFSDPFGGVGLLLCAVLGGLAGTTVDSLLGATLQAIYFCPQCSKETERHPLHSCGSVTRLQRGYQWLNNDMVNFCCSASGALAAVLIGWLVF